MITRVHQLSSVELADIERLLAKCKQHDGNSIPIYKHLIERKHPIACNVLYYMDKQLLAYLRTYFFYADACEVTVMVDPSHRRQGIARQLLQEIIPVLQAEHIHSLIFSTPPDMNDAWFTKLGFTYRNSEYHMQYDPKQKTTVQIKPAHIRPAIEEDIPIMRAIDEAAFPNKKLDPEALFQSLLRTPNCSLFVLVHEQQVIGKAHVFIESDRVRLTDIGILPPYRGQGFGSALIKHCITYALVRNKPRIVLDVETNNESALKLYQALGFKIVNTHDYWVTPENANQYGLESVV